MDVIQREVADMRNALETPGARVRFSVSRGTAEWLTDLLAARSRGESVTVMSKDAEFTPNEAAAILRISRPQVRKLMDEGRLAFRMVGTHHRIPSAAIERLRAWEKEQMTVGMRELAELQNDLGIVE